MNCCKSVTTQLERIEQVTEQLRSNRSKRTAPKVVVAAVNTYREVLGTYRVDSDLTQMFRTSVEPGLQDIWSYNDLHTYTMRLWEFGHRVRRALEESAHRYCRSWAST